MSNLKDLMDGFGDKIQIIPVGPAKAEAKESTPSKRKTVKDYVERERDADRVLEHDKRAPIDELIVEYTRLKKEATAINKLKGELENKLDAMFMDVQGPDKKKLILLEGNRYTYKFESSTYDKVVSKAEIVKAGLLDEFKARGFIKLASRKQRSVDVK